MAAHRGGAGRGGSWVCAGPSRLHDPPRLPRLSGRDREPARARPGGGALRLGARGVGAARDERSPLDLSRSRAPGGCRIGGRSGVARAAHRLVRATRLPADPCRFPGPAAWPGVADRPLLGPRPPPPRSRHEPGEPPHRPHRHLSGDLRARREPSAGAELPEERPARGIAERRKARHIRMQAAAGCPGRDAPLSGGASAADRAHPGVHRRGSSGRRGSGRGPPPGRRRATSGCARR